jgi:hypothetical protein
MPTLLPELGPTRRVADLPLDGQDSRTLRDRLPDRHTLKAFDRLLT